MAKHYDKSDRKENVAPKSNSLDKDSNNGHGSSKSNRRKNSFKFLESPFMNVSKTLTMTKSVSDTITPTTSTIARDGVMSASRSSHFLTTGDHDANNDDDDGSDDISPMSTASTSSSVFGSASSASVAKKKKRPLSFLASSISAVADKYNSTPKLRGKNSVSKDSNSNRKSYFY